MINIIEKGKKKLIYKKDIIPINFIKTKNLNETGVYNSEMDIHSNPKTSENKPDRSNGIFSMIENKVTEIIYGLDDLRTFIKDNSKISHDVIDKSIGEFKSYLASIKSESEVSSSGSID